MSLYKKNADNHNDTDSEGWEEREASRTHSVKFSEDSVTDKEVLKSNCYQKKLLHLIIILLL